jgi:hypothetical protein
MTNLTAVITGSSAARATNAKHTPVRLKNGQASSLHGVLPAVEVCNARVETWFTVGVAPSDVHLEVSSPKRLPKLEECKPHL